MPTLTHDPTQAKIKYDIFYIQRDNFAPPKSPERHESEHRPLPERATAQERLDGRPGRDGRNPSLAAWTREPVYRIANDLVTANHPLAEAAQRRHAQPNRARFELAVCEIILIAPTRLLGEVREQHRSSDLLHEKRQKVSETPPIGGNRRWGRSFLDPEKVGKLIEQGGQAHRLPPRVRHALRRSMGPGEPWINREGRWHRRTRRRRDVQVDDATWLGNLVEGAVAIGAEVRGVAND